MGIFSGFINYIEEDTIRMKSSDGVLECQLLLDSVSDSDFLGYVQAFARMCNKGKEPIEPYFIMALDDEVRKRTVQVQRQVVDTLNTIHRTEKYKTLISNLERNVKQRERYASKQNEVKGNHIPEQKKPNYKAIAQKMPTEKLQKELNSVNSDEEKRAYLIELKERDEYRKKAVKMSINDLKKRCRNIQKGSEKIVYQEEISRRQKIFSKLQKDYIDVAERIEKLTDLYECNVIFKEEYESKMKEWGEKLEEMKGEETKGIEHQSLFADMEKNIPDVVERIKKLKELYDNKVISQDEYEEKKYDWLA